MTKENKTLILNGVASTTSEGWLASKVRADEAQLTGR